GGYGASGGDARVAGGRGMYGGRGGAEGDGMRGDGMMMMRDDLYHDGGRRGGGRGGIAGDPRMLRGGSGGGHPRDLDGGGMYGDMRVSDHHLRGGGGPGDRMRG
ncbi:unnamed protein product, partial [Scytosiphon promiscuus]